MSHCSIIKLLHFMNILCTLSNSALRWGAVKPPNQTSNFMVYTAPPWGCASRERRCSGRRLWPLSQAWSTFTCAVKCHTRWLNVTLVKVMLVLCHWLSCVSLVHGEKWPLHHQLQVLIYCNSPNRWCQILKKGFNYMVTNHKLPIFFKFWRNMFFLLRLGGEFICLSCVLCKAILLLSLDHFPM